MPIFQHEHRSEAELHMYLGANIRPRDPAEDKYHLTRVLAPGAADLAQARLLADYKGQDFRIAITNQGQLGACAAFTGDECAQMAQAIAGGQLVAVHPGWLYMKVRQLEKSFPQDAGSFVADNLDLAIKPGLPKLSLNPYVQDASFAYPATMDQDAPNQVYVASHHPFYPTDGSFLENIWLSLDAGMPVGISMYWTNAFFNPVNGVLPAGQTAAQAVGGHAITCWGIVPPANGLDGLVLCANHWTTGWNTAAVNLGYKCRPGDFAIPWSYFKDTTTNSIVFEARAVSGVALAPQPQPQPQPTSCKNAALGVTNPVLNQMQQDALSNPTSRLRAFRLQGAQAIVRAIQAASF